MNKPLITIDYKDYKIMEEKIKKLELIIRLFYFGEAEEEIKKIIDEYNDEYRIFI